MSDLAARPADADVSQAAGHLKPVAWAPAGAWVVVTQSSAGVTTFPGTASMRPAWKDSVDNQIAELCSMAPNWDGNGSERPQRRPLVLAMAVLERIMRDPYPAPWIVPTTRRGVDLEWRLDQAEMIVRMQPNAPIEVIIEDPTTDLDYEAELGPSDLDQIARLLERRQLGGG